MTRRGDDRARSAGETPSGVPPAGQTPTGAEPTAGTQSTTRPAAQPGRQKSARQGRGYAGALVAEIVGTYLLVFVGTGTVIATQTLVPGPLDATAISLAFGFAVLIAVYALGHISGAHINPAVTIGLAVVRRFPWVAVPGYIAAQLVGALLAAFTTWWMFGSTARSQLALGATTPGVRGEGIALLTEIVITFLLVVTVMGIAIDDRSPGPAVSGAAIGLVVAAAIFVALPLSGGSLNPARTFGPMIVAGEFDGWWVYLVGPIVGGVAGAALWEYVLRRGVPPGAGEQEAEGVIEGEAGRRPREWSERDQKVAERSAETSRTEEQTRKPTRRR